MKTVISAVLIGALCVSASFAQDQAPSPEVGDKIPAFNANDDRGHLWQSGSDQGNDKYLVVFFYPAAMTGGCTKQACTYRDKAEDLETLNIRIVGVSGDPVNNLKLFKKAHSLNFPLVSDVNGYIAGLFGVPAHAGGTFKTRIENADVTLVRSKTTPRWTFILDDQGKVLYKNTKVNAQQDTAKVIEFIKNLKK